MSKHETLLRHQKIINKLQTSKEVTFDEMVFHLENQSELHEFDLVISQRTFQRDIKEIKSLHNVNIRFDRLKKVYFIEADEEDSDLRNRLLEAFDFISTLKMSEDLTKFIYFEKRKAHGTKHFLGLLHAVRNQFIIELSHQKFEYDEPTNRLVEPYGLKESMGRWYLLAKEVGKDKVKTFGLDRIVDFDITRRHFSPPENYNANDDFKYCFGVINSSDVKPQEIILSFEPFQGNYIKSYPLHKSQSVITDNEEELRIRLFLIITDDLVKEILSYAERVTVISPKSLIQDIQKRHEDAFKQYQAK
ncbi:MAG: WYL domain-containing protein [Bacteroidota bacterium]